MYSWEKGKFTKYVLIENEKGILAKSF